MKAIILAGGFAKRMWPITKKLPKPLLPVAGKPMIEHILNKLETLNLSTIYITTNKKFAPLFQEFLDEKNFSSDVRLFVEDHDSEEKKLGSIGAVHNLIKNEQIDDDVLCVAGDNLLDDEMVDFFKFFSCGETIFGLHEMNEGDLSKFGIACIDSDYKVVSFEEKPAHPKSNLVSTAIYAIPRKNIPLISQYLSENNSPDAFGNFISWLFKKAPVYGFVFKNKWFDIGSVEGYKEANEYMKRINENSSPEN